MPGSPHPQRNVVLIAIIVVTAIVVAVVLGLGSDDSADKTVVTRPLPTTSTTAPSTTAPPTAPPSGPTTTILLPDGDYTAMCGQLQGLVDAYGPASSLGEFRSLFEGLDFDALIAASPDGTRQYVETLRDQRQQVLDVLASATSFADLQASALPLTFYDSLQHLYAVAVQKCGFSAG